MSSTPWMKFYPSDWRSDPKLRIVSMAARGLWIEMICLMHEADTYGDLTVSGVALTAETLSRLVGAMPEDVEMWLEELHTAGVFSIRKNGVIYSRRMEKDYWKAQKMRANGKKGGNPKTTKIYNAPGYVYLMRRLSDGMAKVGCSVDPKKRVYKIRMQFPGDKIDLIAQSPVSDMGASELSLHEELVSLGCRKDGEWFEIPPSIIGQLTSRFISNIYSLPMGNTKTTETRGQRPEKKQTKKQADLAAADAACEKFEEFWKSYPSRPNNPKKPTRQKFDRAVKSGADPDEIIRAAKAFARQRQGQDSTFTPMAQTWLGQERWRDMAPAKPEQSSEPMMTINLTSFRVSHVHKMLVSHFSGDGRWRYQTQLGPAPNHPRCEIPEHMIKRAMIEAGQQSPHKIATV